MTRPSQDIARAQQLLAAYGRDLERWPTSARQTFEQLAEVERRRLLQSDQVFETYLDDAKTAIDAMPAPSHLMDKILASTTGQRDSVQAGQTIAQVVPLASQTPAERVPKPIAFTSRREGVAAAALLAASLILGISIGSIDRIQTTLVQVGDLAGISVTAPVAQMTALDAAFQSSDDEDFI